MGMIEVRIHGRGGQGNVVAAYVLAAAGFAEGWHVQAFPAFGAERRGAPVVAFVRLADQPIKRRCQVMQPDALIIQDEALLHVAGITDGLKAGGPVLLNSTRASEEFDGAVGERLVTLAATQMAQQYLGRPVPNTALLAAFLQLSQLLPVAALSQALTERFKGAVLERNQALVAAAAESVAAGSWQEVLHA